ncbi:hypothetical protein EVAR_83041_1 [Eumeta japonica]|uniref:Uncharacterized protein n=1 Tax=Eumeta variegata TaxID=151549 RepID=A0A4C1VQ46_EUMVA|nr:hypothetical protein EVAR_83041_1 [Eumeta japonica]
MLPHRIVVTVTMSLRARHLQCFFVPTLISHSVERTEEYGRHSFDLSLTPRVCKMDKSLKRSQPSTSGTSVNSGGGESNPKKNRHYDDSYLKYGFTVINNKP